MFEGKITFEADRTPLYDNELIEKLTESLSDYLEQEVGDEGSCIANNADVKVYHECADTYVSVVVYASDMQFLELCKNSVSIYDIAYELCESFNNQCDVMGEWVELKEKYNYLTGSKFELCELAEMCGKVKEFNELYTSIDNYVADSAWDKVVRIKTAETRSFTYAGEEGE